MLHNSPVVLAESVRKPVTISVIILSFNEELDIEACLKSVIGWAQDVFVVDSFSTDHTVEIAQRYGVLVFQNEWTSFARQREWAVTQLNLHTEWIFFLDADERLTTEMKEEIRDRLSNPHVDEDGFYIKRRFFFLNRWLKHGGYYPLAELRVLRWSRVQFLDEGGGSRERFFVAGKTDTLKSDALHIYDKGLANWIDKHTRLANLEVGYLVDQEQNTSPKVIGRIGSTTWLRAHVWPRLPRSIRPPLLFLYRYFLRLGFLDGLEGFYYCALHDFWYPLLIEALYLEKSRGKNCDF